MNRQKDNPKACAPNRDLTDFISKGAYPLSSACALADLEVVGFSGGRNFSSKLASLGIYPGSRLKMICNSGGPVIVEVKGSRLSIGQGMAQKIIVH